MIKISLLLLSFLITSCAVKDFYQVYKAKSENGILQNDKLIFQDNNTLISYDLWKEGGNIGFNIYNKTDQDLTLDLTNTYFIINGVAYEYFQNRTFTKSTTRGTSYAPYSYHFAQVEGSGFSTAYTEKPKVNIPSHTSINITEYSVSQGRHIDCDLTKYPSKNVIKTVNYDKGNSPFVFYNIISYSSNNEITKFENRFYVSEITNLPNTEMYTSVDISKCGRKLSPPVKVFTKQTPDKFYVKYSRSGK